MSALRINLLGSPEVYRDGAQIAFARRKATALLAYLCMERRAHSRDALSELLFPNTDRRRASSSFRVILFSLRSKLGSDAIVSDHRSVRLAEDCYDCDVAQFEAGISVFRVDGGRLKEILALYRGDFLASFYLDACRHFEAWQLAQQERLRSSYATFLDTVAHEAVERDEKDKALRACSELLTLDPADEAVHREIMRIHADSGRYGLATQQFERCKEILARELDAPPEEETFELYSTIVRRERAAMPTGLPEFHDAFVGRAVERSTLLRMVGDEGVRLVTVVGGPGIGKTRLAIEAAGELELRFPDGCAYVDLSHAGDHHEVARLIATSIGIRDKGGGRVDAMEIVERALNDREVLLVLDGFDAVLDAASQLSRLLDRCTHVAAVVTSRETLGARRERLVRLGPLPVSSGPNSSAEAVDLFVERCRDAGRNVKPSELPVIVEICERLEGVPLTIELAAARLDVLSVEELRRRLHRALSVLSVAGDVHEDRHRTLRRAIDWSYQLLSNEERVAFQAISLCPAGVTVRLAENVLAFLSSEPLDLIDSLVRKSLISRIEHEGASRLVMLDTTRAFGREMVLSQDTLSQIQEPIYRYFKEIAAESSTVLRGAAQIRSLDLLEAEWPNLRWVLNELVHDDRCEEALRMSADLGWFWYLTGRGGEAISHVEGALTAGGNDLPVKLRAWAHHTRGWALFTLGRWKEAREAYKQSRRLFEDTDDRDGIILSLARLGVAERWLDNDLVGIDLAEKAVELSGDGAGALIRTYALICAYATSDGRCVSPDQRAGLEEALRTCRAGADTWGAAHAQNGLGDLARASGHHDDALNHYHEAAAGFRLLRDRWMEAWNLAGMGRSLYCMDRCNAAFLTLADAAVLFRDRGSSADCVFTLLHLGIALSGGSRLTHVDSGASRSVRYPPDRMPTHREDAAVFLAAFFALRDDLRLPDLGSRDLEDPDTVAMISEIESEHNEQWQRGRTMSLDSALEFARELQASLAPLKR